jgi:hypothetical protein
MSWNYRLFKEKVKAHPQTDEMIDRYTIREVYYDSEGNPNGYTSEPIKPESFMEDGDSTPIADIQWQLESMLKSLRKPILIEEDFK